MQITFGRVFKAHSYKQAEEKAASSTKSGYKTVIGDIPRHPGEGALIQIGKQTYDLPNLGHYVFNGKDANRYEEIQADLFFLAGQQRMIRQREHSSQERTLSDDLMGQVRSFYEEQALKRVADLKALIKKAAPMPEPGKQSYGDNRISRAERQLRSLFHAAGLEKNNSPQEPMVLPGTRVVRTIDEARASEG